MAEKTIEEMMSPAHHVNSDIRADEARGKMLENNIRHYAVTNGKNIIGLLSNKDLNF